MACFHFGLLPPVFWYTKHDFFFLCSHSLLFQPQLLQSPPKLKGKLAKKTCKTRACKAVPNTPLNTLLQLKFDSCANSKTRLPSHALHFIQRASSEQGRGRGGGELSSTSQNSALTHRRTVMRPAYLMIRTDESHQLIRVWSP